MIHTIRFCVLAALLFLLHSCSINTETTYYKDAASSMESNILINRGMLSMLNGATTQKQQTDFSRLSTDWQSFYDLQKDNFLTVNKDSAKVLEKLMIKVNKKQGEIYGISLKYDKLLPGEIATLFRQSKELRKLPLQNIGKWDGKSLTIDTNQFNSASFLTELEDLADSPTSENPRTKSDSVAAYGRQMAESVMGMMKMFPVNLSKTIKFQRPIKSIVGKHEFVKQIDRKTIQITLRSNDLLETKDEPTDTKNDRKIVITTE